MYHWSLLLPQEMELDVVLGKCKAEVLGLEQPRTIKSHSPPLDTKEWQLSNTPGTSKVDGEDSEGDNLSVFTNMPPVLSLPGNVAGAGPPVVIPVPEIDYKIPVKRQSSGHGQEALASISKPLEPDTTTATNMVPDNKGSKGQELPRSCKSKQPQRSCSIDTTTSDSDTSLEKTQPSSANDEDDEEQKGGMKLTGFVHQVQEWADMLEDIRAARGGTLTFEIFGDEPSDCPKLLHILQEIDTKKNWITREEAQSTRLAKNLNLVLKTCDVVEEAQTVHVGRRILDNFAQRFLNRRYPDDSTGSGGN
ncbi:hypothetical protein EDC04DRAFT_583086 [Pisolithus marmoratus]|nr:hypothetical protein EDC04DRAFT_583086 [Pisolithus marmoratus]